MLLLSLLMALSLQACTSSDPTATEPQSFDLIKDYKSEDPDLCARMRFTCDEGLKVFFDERGCGCTGPKETSLRKQESDSISCGGSYSPVCGKLRVQCITEPCDPALQTFGNRCFAEGAGAFDIVDGKCEELDQNTEGAI